MLEGPELLARLAALVPAPYLNMTRYHGVFAPRSKWRSRLPAPAERWAVGERLEAASPSGSGDCALPCRVRRLLREEWRAEV